VPDGEVSRNLVPLKQVPTFKPWTSERLLRHLIATRQLPHHKVGRRIYIALEDVDDLAERGRIEAVRPRLRAVRDGP
jgi:hypothetical protein